MLLGRRKDGGGIKDAEGNEKRRRIKDQGFKI